MKWLRIASSILILFFAFSPDMSSSSAAAAVMIPQSILSFDRPPGSPVRLPLTVLMRLDQRTIPVLTSPHGSVEVASLINNYKSVTREPRKSPVDLCQVVDGAKNWIPTAEVEVVPYYVPLALALDQNIQTNCSNVFKGSARFDAGKTNALIAEFAARTAGPPPTASSSWLPAARDPALTALVAHSTKETIPGALSIGKPLAYYVQVLLVSAGLKPSYGNRRPDKYLLVDFAFTAHEQPLLEYESILFRVNVVMENGKTFTHAMMPEALYDGQATTSAYEIQTSGIVLAVPRDQAGRHGWGRIYERLIPQIRSFGLGESGFSWAFTKSRFTLTGSKNPSVVLELPAQSVGRKLKLFIEVRAQINRRGIPNAANSPTTCFLIGLEQDAPEVSQCN